MAFAGTRVDVSDLLNVVILQRVQPVGIADPELFVQGTR